MCWTHSCVALVCDSATLPESGDCTSMKSRAMVGVFLLSVNCSCPGHLSIQVISEKSAFSVCQCEQLPIHLRQSPASIISRTHHLFLQYVKKLDVTSGTQAHIVFLGWAIRRVIPKGCLSPYLGSSLTKNYFLITFLPDRTNHFLLFIHRLP